MGTRGQVRGVAFHAILACAALGMIAAAGTGCGLFQRKAQAPAVSVEAAARRDISVTIEATGVVEPIDLVEVKSKASGQILSMPVEVGSVVRAGQLLAQIDKVDVQNQYEQAAAAERAAQAKVDVSTAALKRADDLFAQQIITVVEHEAATLDYANAAAQLVKAKTDLDTARQRRADATVTAPVAGTILQQLVSAGQVIVSATSSVSGGTTLLQMADLGRVRIRALVAETDIGSVHPGQAATVSVEAFAQRSFVGEVEKVEPQAVVQQSVTMFPVLISITNEDGLLLPGMNGEVSMQVDRRDNVLAVPLDAVRTARELPTVALTLGLDADTVQAQITREIAARVGQRARPGATRPDSTRSWGAGVGTARAESRTARTESSAARTESSATAGAGSGAGSAGREQAGRGQAVLVKTATGIEPRLVRIGLSDFDYAEILGGIKEGEEVVLLSVVEQQAKRTADQSQLKARMGSGIPGSAPAAGGRATGGGH